MSPSLEFVGACADAIGAAVGLSVVVAAFVGLIWPHFAAIFMDYDSGRWLEGATVSRGAPTRTSAILHTIVLGTIMSVSCTPVFVALFTISPWSGGAVVCAFAVHCIIAVHVVRAAMRRSTDPGHWLREHGLSSYEIGVVEKSHALSTLTNAALYVCWAVAFAVPLRLLTGHTADFALLASATAATVITPLVIAGEKLERRLRVADQLQIHLKAACRPNAELEPLSIRIRRGPDQTPADQWQSGLPRERAALISASTLLQRLLRQRTRSLRSLDQGALLDSAQPLFQDLAELAASTQPIASSPVITRAVRLAFLGDTAALASGWARAHRVSDHRAWSPWTLKRVATVTTSTVTIAAAAITSVVAVIKALAF